MFRSTYTFIAALAFIIVAPAQADPTNVRPHEPVGGLGGLQTVFNDLLVSGPGIDAVNSQHNAALFTNTASGGAVATFIIELAAFGGTNAFGIYSASDPSVKAEVFDGSDAGGDQALISFMANGNIKVNGSVVATGFSRNFGFYIDVYEAGVGSGGDGDSTTLDYTLYSEDSRNGGGAAQALIYQGDDQSVLELPGGFAPGTFTDDEIIVAFEDRRIDLGVSDENYTDLVVLVESVQPVPAPGAALLCMMGMGIVGFVKRRLA